MICNFPSFDAVRRSILFGILEEILRRCFCSKKYSNEEFLRESHSPAF